MVVSFGTEHPSLSRLSSNIYIIQGFSMGQDVLPPPPPTLIGSILPNLNLLVFFIDKIKATCKKSVSQLNIQALYQHIYHIGDFYGVTCPPPTLIGSKLPNLSLLVFFIDKIKATCKKSASQLNIYALNQICPFLLQK